MGNGNCIIKLKKKSMLLYKNCTVHDEITLNAGKHMMALQN
jgi:hypothetical protein